MERLTVFPLTFIVSVRLDLEIVFSNIVFQKNLLLFSLDLRFCMNSIFTVGFRSLDKKSLFILNGFI